MAGTAKPERTRVYENFVLDSPRWDHYQPRDGDIVISTSYKAGTTWTQNIVGLLIFQTPELPGQLHDLSPWLDMRILPFKETLEALEAQDRRRFIKTHLPLDGLPFYDNVQYIYVGRDPRDVALSLFNHISNYKPGFLEMVNGNPDRKGPPHPQIADNFPEFWRDWATKGWFDWERDGYPYWSHLHHAKTWWEYKDLPNVLMLHYNDMLADLDGEMRRIAKFLNIEVSEDVMPSLVEAAKFDSMKKNYKQNAPAPDLIWADAQKFFRKGTNGRWKEYLTEEDLALYDKTADQVLSPDLRKWLEDGGPIPA